MLKSVKLIVGVAAVVVFAVGCKSKVKTSDAQAPVGGQDGQVMGSEVTSKPLEADSMGSDSGKINGLQTVHFDYDSSNLSTSSRKQLAENGEWIKSNAGVTVQIEGHCDSRGSVEYNLALGERRAKSVKNYLVGLGVDSKRLTIISYGEEKPLDTSDSEAAFSKNRRANFVPLAQ